MTLSLLIFNKTMEDDTLKNQKPSRWVGLWGRYGRGGLSKFCGVGEGKAALLAAETLQETEALLDNFVYIWKEAGNWRD